MSCAQSGHSGCRSITNRFMYRYARHSGGGDTTISSSMERDKKRERLVLSEACCKLFTLCYFLFNTPRSTIWFPIYRSSAFLNGCTCLTLNKSMYPECAPIENSMTTLDEFSVSSALLVSNELCKCTYTLLYSTCIYYSIISFIFALYCLATARCIS